MTAQQYQWMGPQAPRAKAIPASAWSSHKAELESLYQEMKLDDVMTKMKEKYGFEPTRRQYVFQFSKWQFQKQNRTNIRESMSDHDVDACSPTSLLSQHTLLPALSPNNQIKKSHQSLGGIKRKTVSPLPPEKRLKTSGSSSESITDGEATIVANPALDYADKAECWPSYTDSLPPRSPSPTLSAFESRSTDKDNIEEIAFQLIQDVPQVRLSLDVMEPFDVICGLEHTRIRDVVTAADFLAVSQCPTDAFVLYLLLIKRQLSQSDLPGWMFDSATIGCVRSAMSASHLQIVKNLLEHQLKKITGDDRLMVRTFIYNTFLTDVYEKLGDKSAAKSCYSQAGTCIQNLETQTSTLLEMRDNERAQFLGAYRTFTRYRLSYERYPYTRDVEYQLKYHMKQQYWHNMYGTVNIMTIRVCLIWCLEQLKQTPYTPLKSLIGIRLCSDRYFAIYIAVYHSLFRAWSADGGSSKTYLWLAHIQDKTNLSCAKFLAVVAFMIADHGNWTNEYSTLGMGLPLACDWNLDDILAAAHTICSALVEFDNSELASAFTSAYEVVSDGTFGRSELEQVSYEYGLRPFTKDLVEPCLNLKLPPLPPLELVKLKEGPALPEEPQYLLPLSRPPSNGVPTLAPSLHSSGFLSMISLKNRLKGKRHDGYDAALPSNYMRHGSRSTLSGFLASGRRSLSWHSRSRASASQFGSDALDSLTGFSARTRSGVLGDRRGSTAELLDLETLTNRYSNMSVD